jgi:hypothetical protein
MALTVLAHLCIFGAVLLAMECYANDDAKRLYHDLLIQNKYNKLIRPVGNNTDRPLTVKMGIRLSQIIDVVSVSYISYWHFDLFLFYSFYTKQYTGLQAVTAFNKHEQNMFDWYIVDRWYIFLWYNDIG